MSTYIITRAADILSRTADDFNALAKTLDSRGRREEGNEVREIARQIDRTGRGFIERL